MNVYQTITDRIVKQLEEGTVPWRRPWKTSLPRNLVSGKHYRGVNILMLGTAGFASSYWLTFNQARKLGGSVRKGEHGTPVVFTDWFEVKDEETGEEKKRPFLKRFTVFNLEQTDGIEKPVEERRKPVPPIERCERIVGGMPDRPTIDFDGGDRAYYNVATDAIHLPMKTCFDSAEGYYGTLFHEMVHSSGHPRRLDRKGVAAHSGFGTESYSQEELVAEIGSAFLCGLTGIESATVDNAASYISGWLEALKNDKRMLFFAAGDAQKAVDWICRTEGPYS